MRGIEATVRDLSPDADCTQQTTMIENLMFYDSLFHSPFLRVSFESFYLGRRHGIEFGRRKYATVTLVLPRHSPHSQKYLSFCLPRWMHPLMN